MAMIGTSWFCYHEAIERGALPRLYGLLLYDGISFLGMVARADCVQRHELLGYDCTSWFSYDRTNLLAMTAQAAFY